MAKRYKTTKKRTPLRKRKKTTKRKIKKKR